MDIYLHHRLPTWEYQMSSYITGFLLSILFTIDAYLLATRNVVEGAALVASLIGLAVLQLLVQLIFFLHLGKKTESRWRIPLLLFAATVVLIIVVGSLWIMNNLNYHMSPDETENYLIQDEGIVR